MPLQLAPLTVRRAWPTLTSPALVLNDVHAQLNRTRVARCFRVRSTQEVQAAVRQARLEGRAISVAGGRHAMGGQQFGTDSLHVDMTGMDRIVAFDAQRGTVEAEAGIQWPALIHALLDRQRGRRTQWGIIQKQTGADALTLGGALAANVHGRGLGLKPLAADIEAFSLVDANGQLLRCSRHDHPGLFRLAVGGYGLFGIVTSVRLRLRKRQQLQRMVTMIEVDELIPAFAQRMEAGYLYGDFQFAIDRGSAQFLRTGILSCYRPVEEASPMPSGQKRLSRSQWDTLVYLAHVDPHRAFAEYAAHYRSTSGHLYWSDLHQMSTYVGSYHASLDRRLGSPHKATEIITEVYVPRQALADFLADVREDFRAHAVPLIYGTIRLIERDDDTFLAWATAPFACVIFNLHTEHTPRGLAQSAGHFRRLLDLAIGRGGSFYLTYHRFATKAHVASCYPHFFAFLRLKRAYDPDERFQSDWYRHYATLFNHRQDTTGREE